MSLGHDAGEEVAALTYDPVREDQERLMHLDQQVAEPCPPLAERLLQEGPPFVAEQIENDITDRQPLANGIEGTKVSKTRGFSGVIILGLKRPLAQNAFGSQFHAILGILLGFLLGRAVSHDEPDSLETSAEMLGWGSHRSSGYAKSS